MRKISSLIDTKDIALTIYNGGFGAVKEIRTVNMSGNETELVYADVAQKIETDSLIIEGLNILEFNYDFDLVDRDNTPQLWIEEVLNLGLDAVVVTDHNSVEWFRRVCSLFR